MNYENNLILIVEDDEFLADLISEKIQESGFQTINFNRGKEAMEWLRDNKPFILLLDYSLPDFSGIEFINELRAAQITVPPFIMSTGQGDERIAVQMMKLGARDYLVKDIYLMDRLPEVLRRVGVEIDNEQKILKSERALVKTKDRLIRAELAAKTGNCELNLKTMILSISHGASEIYEFENKKFPYEELKKIILPEYHSIVATSLQNTIETRTKSDCEYTIKAAVSGKIKDIHSSVFFDNASESVFAIIQDVTEKKRLDKALIESEVKYRELVENSPQAIIIHIDFKVFYINKAGITLFGAETADEIIGKNAMDFVHPDSKALVIERLRSTPVPGMVLDSAEERFIRLDKSTFYAEIKSMSLLIDSKLAYQVIITDISDRKEAKIALEESELRFRKLFENAPDATFLADTETSLIKDANIAACKLLKRNREDIIGLHQSDIHPKEKKVNAVSIFQKHITETQKGEISQLTEDFAIQSDGNLVPVEIVAQFITIADKRMMLGIFRDISERKKAETLLRESEVKYRELVENSPEAITIYIDGKVTYVNKFCLTLMGVNSSTELIGRNVMDFVHPDSQALALERMKMLQVPGTVLDSTEEKFIRFDKSIAYVEVKSMSLMIGDKLAVQLIIRDVSERKKTQEAFLENHRALQILTDSVTELIETNEKDMNFSKLTETFHQISGAKFAAFNFFEKDGLSYRTVGFSGLNNIHALSKKYLNFDFLNKRWENDLVRAEKIKESTITRFNNLNDLINHVLPKSMTFLIEKAFNIGHVYIVKITQNDILKGDFTLLFEKGTEIKHPEILELYARQIGLYLVRKQAEIELIESEQKFKLLFEENPQPMLIYNLETLQILRVNNTAINFYGYTRDEFRTMKIDTLHPKEELSVFYEKMEKAKKGIDTDGISKHVKKNGHEIWVEVASTSVSNFGQHARHVMINDITDRKLAEDELMNSLSLLNATLESTTDGILVANLDGNITILNKKFIDMWGVPENIIPENNRYKILEYVSKMVVYPKKLVDDTNKIYLYPDKSSFDILELIDGRTFERVSLPQRIGDKIVGRVWSIRDITERMVAENKLKQRMDEMTRFQNLTVGRELFMINLKKEINALLVQSGQAEKYVIVG